jgi:hypothetical protein
LRNAPPRIGLYFYDGPHDYRSQLIGLLRAEPILADRALIIVDDQNFPAVKQATWDFLAVRKEASLLFELPTPANCHPSFWNGLYVLAWDRATCNALDWALLHSRRQPDLLESLDLLQQIKLKRLGGQIVMQPMNP